MGAAGELIGDNTEKIGLHPRPVQQGQRPDCPVPSSLPAGVDPQRIVELPGPVQREPHQEPMLPQEVRPLPVQRHPVGLYGVGDAEGGRAYLPLQRQKGAVKFQPRQCGLPPLEGDLHRALRTHGLDTGGEETACGLLGHPPHVLYLSAV